VHGASHHDRVQHVALELLDDQHDDQDGDRVPDALGHERDQDGHDPADGRADVVVSGPHRGPGRPSPPTRRRLREEDTWS
jgi:hypothetical protein